MEYIPVRLNVLCPPLAQPFVWRSLAEGGAVEPSQLNQLHVGDDGTVLDVGE